MRDQPPHLKFTLSRSTEATIDPTPAPNESSEPSEVTLSILATHAGILAEVQSVAIKAGIPLGRLLGAILRDRARASRAEAEKLDEVAAGLDALPELLKIDFA